jgi:flavin reductase (DIM6/NTAB) family NADH-FMN oxidoreductase RutF
VSVAGETFGDTVVIPAMNPETASRRATFIEAMSHTVSGVAVATTDGPAGRFGLTVSSFCSLDADPPMVLVCISQRSPIIRGIMQNQVLAISVLADWHAELADTFAGRPNEGDKYDFDRWSWTTGESGSPLLEGAVAHFDCDLAESYKAATHIIFTATVRRSDFQTTIPLLYTKRTYGVPTPIPASIGPIAAEPAPREDLE